MASFLPITAKLAFTKLTLTKGLCLHQPITCSVHSTGFTIIPNFKSVLFKQLNNTTFSYCPKGKENTEWRLMQQQSSKEHCWDTQYTQNGLNYQQLTNECASPYDDGIKLIKVTVIGQQYLETNVKNTHSKNYPKDSAINPATKWNNDIGTVAVIACSINGISSGQWPKPQQPYSPVASGGCRANGARETQQLAGDRLATAVCLCVLSCTDTGSLCWLDWPQSLGRTAGH